MVVTTISRDGASNMAMMQGLAHNTRARAAMTSCDRCTKKLAYIDAWLVRSNVREDKQTHLRYKVWKFNTDDTWVHSKYETIMCEKCKNRFEQHNMALVAS